MNFYQKKPHWLQYQLFPIKSHKKFYWKQIAIIVIILAVFVVSLSLFNEQIKNTFYVAFSPISKNLWKAGNNSSVFFESFFSSENIKQQNSNLKKENQKLLSEIVFLQNELRKSESATKVMQNSEMEKFNTILTQIIGFDVNNDIILIDKGSLDGVFENMPVISEQNVLYGKVLKSYKNFSEVILISNQNHILDAKVVSLKDSFDQNDSSTQTIVYGAIKGNGNLSVYLDLVPSDAKLQKEDIIVTSALDKIFPKDILIGKVYSVAKSDLKPFQTAQIQLFFDIKNVENLFVITNYKQ